MKSIVFSIATLLSTLLLAQTPIDGLQKSNLSYLESQESKGFEFRSQIITEFDQAHASQNVNIKLNDDYTYIVVALGDSDIPEINLEIKPAGNAKMEALPLAQDLAGESFLVTPSKSGRSKMSIHAKGLGEAKNGFISFMVLRKE